MIDSTDMYTDPVAFEFFDCINRGEVKRLQTLIDEGFELNYASKKIYSPLMAAVASGQIEVVDLLIRNGADVNLVGPNYETALDMANKFYDTWRRHGARKSLVISRKIKEFLTRNGAKTSQELGVADQWVRRDIYKKDEILFNTIKTIAKSGNKEKLSQFIDKKLSGCVDTVIASAIMEEAFLTDNPKMVELLREKYADLTHQDSDGNTYLHLAAQKGCLNVVQALLKAEVDELIENYDQQTAFQVALEADQKEVVQLMLQQNATGNDNPQIMLNEAINTGDTSMVHMVLELYAKELDLKRAFLSCLEDKNSLKFSGFGVDAVKANRARVDIASFILKEMGDVKDLTTTEGEPILSYVINDYHLQPLLPELVKQGVDPMVLSSQEGDSPLGVAIRKGAFDLAKMMVLDGADVNQANQYGVTPLMQACAGKDDASLALLLIEKGADITAQLPGNHKNALSLAADEGNFNIVNKLLPMYKNISEDGINGINYVERALMRGRYDSVEEIGSYFRDVREQLALQQKRDILTKRNERLHRFVKFFKKKPQR